MDTRLRQIERDYLSGSIDTLTYIQILKRANFEEQADELLRDWWEDIRRRGDPGLITRVMHLHRNERSERLTDPNDPLFLEIVYWLQEAVDLANAFPQKCSCRRCQFGNCQCVFTGNNCEYPGTTGTMYGGTIFNLPAGEGYCSNCHSQPDTSLTPGAKGGCTAAPTRIETMPIKLIQSKAFSWSDDSYKVIPTLECNAQHNTRFLASTPGGITGPTRLALYPGKYATFSFMDALRWIKMHARHGTQKGNFKPIKAPPTKDAADRYLDRFKLRRNPDKDIRDLERSWKASGDEGDFRQWYVAARRVRDPKAEKHRCDYCGEGFSQMDHKCDFCPAKVCEACQYSRAPDLLISGCRICHQPVCTPWVNDEDPCGVPVYDYALTHSGADHPSIYCEECCANYL